MKQRLVYIDRLKGFAIYLVVLGHIYQKLVMEGTSHAIFSVIYAFHMPLFFFLSGYISQKTNRVTNYKDAIPYLAKKATNLLVPLLAWSLINHVFFSLSKDYSITKLVSVALHQFKEPGLWFLLMLFKIFIAYVPFHLLSSYLKFSLIKDLLLITITMVLILVIGKLFNFSGGLTFLLNYTFFMMGVLLDKHKVIKEIILKKWFFIISLIVFVTVVSFYNFNLSHIVSMKIIKLIAATFAIVFLYNASIKVKLPEFLDKFLAKLGKWTMVIYTTHFVFFYLIPSNVYFPLNTHTFLLFGLVNTVVVIFIYLCLGIGFVAQFFPFIDFLLYGKIIKKSNNLFYISSKK